MSLRICAIAIASMAFSCAAQSPAPETPASSPPVKLYFRPNEPTAKDGATAAEQIAELKAQTIEMRRSEDRLYNFVFAVMGVVGTVAIALIGVSIWNAKTMHERDIKHIRDGVSEELTRFVREQLVPAAEQRLNNEISNKNAYLQNYLMALFLGHITDVWIEAGKVESAASAAIQMFSEASHSNTNLKPTAIDKLVAAFEEASKININLGERELSDAERVALEFEPTSERSKMLQNLVAYHRQWARTGQRPP